jgi:hypothetical protein
MSERKFYQDGNAVQIRNVDAFSAGMTEIEPLNELMSLLPALRDLVKIHDVPVEWREESAEPPAAERQESSHDVHGCRWFVWCWGPPSDIIWFDEKNPQPIIDKDGNSWTLESVMEDDWIELKCPDAFKPRCEKCRGTKEHPAWPGDEKCVDAFHSERQEHPVVRKFRYKQGGGRIEWRGPGQLFIELSNSVKYWRERVEQSETQLAKLTHEAMDRDSPLGKQVRLRIAGERERDELKRQLAAANSDLYDRTLEITSLQQQLAAANERTVASVVCPRCEGRQMDSVGCNTEYGNGNPEPCEFCEGTGRVGIRKLQADNDRLRAAIGKLPKLTDSKDFFDDTPVQAFKDEFDACHAAADGTDSCSGSEPSSVTVTLPDGPVECEVCDELARLRSELDDARSLAATATDARKEQTEICRKTLEMAEQQADELERLRKENERLQASVLQYAKAIDECYPTLKKQAKQQAKRIKSLENALRDYVWATNHDNRPLVISLRLNAERLLADAGGGK